MEIWQVLDEHRQPTAREVVRGENWKQGDYHLVVHVCLFNPQGQMLIQQRQVDKKGWPNLWDVSCGGSALKGETSQQAASRELFEEIGVPYDFTDIRPFLTINFERGFDDFYCIEQEVEHQSLVLQEEEVQAVKWATEQEIVEAIEQGVFVPYHPSFISYLFAQRAHYGCIQLERRSSHA